MTFRENNQRLESFAIIIQLLKVTNPSFSEPMMICNDTQDVVHNGETFIALPFDFKPPEDNEGGAPQLVFTIDNVGRALTDELEKVIPGSETMAELILISSDEPDVVQHRFKMPIVDVTLDGAKAMATASVSNFMQRPACKLVADKFTLPGIF